MTSVRLFSRSLLWQTSTYLLRSLLSCEKRAVTGEGVWVKSLLITMEAKIHGQGEYTLQSCEESIVIRFAVIEEENAEIGGEQKIGICRSPLHKTLQRHLPDEETGTWTLKVATHLGHGPICTRVIHVSTNRSAPRSLLL